MNTAYRAFPFATTWLLVMLLSVLPTACKTTPTQNQQSAIAIAVDIAAGYAIQRGSNDPVVWKAKATEFRNIALKLQAVNSAGSATLATLRADLQPLIATLPPADVLAANALLAAVTPYLEQQLQANPTVAATQMAVGKILQAVLDACAAYGAT